jgi:excisionase family DNA binding protein
VEEIAAHLRASKDTIYRWIEQRGLPATKIGRRWKAKLSEVDAWAKSGGADDGAFGSPAVGRAP